MSDSITVIETSAPGGLAMTIQQAITRYNAVLEFTKLVMKSGKDYGIVPGTDKPTLLKPGSEKLCSLFGYAPRFIVADKIIDFENGLFYIQYECQLIDRRGVLVASGLGSCNSREKKYRYRNGERTCPNCGKATIIKGKEEYGGGWLCFAKKGGCGAKFAGGHPAIEQQQIGQIENPDIADLLNTIDKMAQKRSLVAAVLIGCNASEYFTQDLEDMGFIEGSYTDQTIYTAAVNNSAASVATGNAVRNAAPEFFTGEFEPEQQPAKSNGKPKPFNPVAALVEWGLSENAHSANALMNRYAKTHKGAVNAEALKEWATIYRSWRNAGTESEAAAQNADAGAKLQ